MFKIVEKRAKSYKLQNADGVEFFVKKAWVRKDGSFTPATFKAEKEALENKAMRDTATVKLPVINWENEKCLGFDFSFDHVHIDHRVKLRVFIPKSMVKNGCVAQWFFSKKIDEAMKNSGKIDEKKHYMLADIPEAWFINTSGEKEELIVY